MKNKRIKAIEFTSTEQYLAAVDQVVRDEAALRQYAASHDRAVQGLKDAYAKMTRPVEAAMRTNVLLCANYAEENRDELYPKNSKSAESTLGRHGFRTGNLALALTSKKGTWEKVLAALQRFHLTDFIRDKPTVDKEAILAKARATMRLAVRDEDMDAEHHVALADVGLKVVQEETYFIEPKSDGGATIKAQEAKAS